MVRKILHFDLDAFYCAVEERRNAELKGVPFAVGGRPESRGVVASCSYAARRFGIRSAMGMAQAVRLCPQLRILPPDMRAYGQMSGRVMEILHRITPLVEQLSIDEAFLDVTEQDEYATVLARQLQGEVEEQLGLPSSLGAATNKLVAKIATDVGKAAVQTDDYPRAIQVVPPGREAEFLAPLPVDALWGLGRARVSGWRRLAFARSRMFCVRSRRNWRDSSVNWGMICDGKRRDTTSGQL